MYKQVFDYNGNPYLVLTNEDGSLSEKDLKEQGVYQYTEIMPPSNLYPPRKFDGEKWYGATANDTEKNDNGSTQKPDPLELIVSQLQMQIAKGNVQLRETQEKLANAMLEISKLKGSVE